MLEGSQIYIHFFPEMTTDNGLKEEEGKRGDGVHCPPYETFRARLTSAQPCAGRRLPHRAAFVGGCAPRGMIAVHDAPRCTIGRPKQIICRRRTNQVRESGSDAENQLVGIDREALGHKKDVLSGVFGPPGIMV